MVVSLFMEIPKENIDGLLKRKDYFLFTKRFVLGDVVWVICLSCLREGKWCKAYALEQKMEKPKTEYFRGKIGKPLKPCLSHT